jgi:hypothetical protein
MERSQEWLCHWCPPAHTIPLRSSVVFSVSMRSSGERSEGGWHVCRAGRRTLPKRGSWGGSRTARAHGHAPLQIGGAGAALGGNSVPSGRCANRLLLCYSKAVSSHAHSKVLRTSQFFAQSSYRRAIRAGTRPCAPTFCHSEAAQGEIQHAFLSHCEFLRTGDLLSNLQREVSIETKTVTSRTLRCGNCEVPANQRQ